MSRSSRREKEGGIGMASKVLGFRRTLHLHDVMLSISFMVFPNPMLP